MVVRSGWPVAVAKLMGLTTDPNDPRLTHGDTAGQAEVYLVLSDEERAKGFVRPVRTSYVHVGPPGPTHPLRDLTPAEHDRYDRFAYVKYEPYSDDGDGGSSGCFWTQARLDNIDRGCGAETRMGTALAETYARDPQFYGATFCVSCNKHLPVVAAGEFVWLDGSRVGS